MAISGNVDGYQRYLPDPGVSSACAAARRSPAIDALGDSPAYIATGDWRDFALYGVFDIIRI